MSETSGEKIASSTPPAGIIASSTPPAGGKPRVLYGDPNGALVRRKIVVFRRLEPGDTIAPGGHPLRESPYLEGKIMEIAVGKAAHDDMVRLAERRGEVLAEGSSLFASYDLPGSLIAGAGGGLFGIWLDYLPWWLGPYLTGVVVLGVVLGFVTRVRKRGAELAAEEKWKAAPERKEYDAIARELAERWIAFSLDVKKEHGFHTEVRVAEGSDDPLRLASVDPRGFIATPPWFDPEDFLPTEGGGVRYEAVHAGGEVVTRLCEGDRDLPESYAPAGEGGGESESKGESESESKGESKGESEGESESESKGESESESESKGESEGATSDTGATPADASPKADA